MIPGFAAPATERVPSKLAPPVIAIETDGANPTFHIDLDAGVLNANFAIIHAFVDSGAGFSESGTGHRLTAAELSTGNVDLSDLISGLASGSHDVKMTLENEGGASADSNTVTVTSP